MQGLNPLHAACKNFHADVAEFLLDQPRIDPLATNNRTGHALSLSLLPYKTPDHLKHEYHMEMKSAGLIPDEIPDRGLPILELFHRKAPQALHWPVDMSGKNASGQ